jgi:hypothetical protein
VLTVGIRQTHTRLQRVVITRRITRHIRYAQLKRQLLFLVSTHSPSGFACKITKKNNAQLLNINKN